jgi:hypothetical protein
MFLNRHLRPYRNVVDLKMLLIDAVPKITAVAVVVGRTMSIAVLVHANGVLKVPGQNDTL